MRWNERENSFGLSAQKKRSATLKLPNCVSKDVLIIRLKIGIPPFSRDQAHLISGTFHDVVARLSRVSSAQWKREAIRKMGKSALDIKASNKYAS